MPKKTSNRAAANKTHGIGQRGKTIGALSGKGVQHTWIKLLHDNEESQTKLTDKQISKKVKVEFPKRKTVTYKVSAVRRKLNRGEFDDQLGELRIEPFTSNRYDEDGSIIKSKTKGRQAMTADASSPDGPAQHRPKGARRGRGIEETWILLFKENEERPKKWTDEQITEQMLLEFPGRKSAVFHQVHQPRGKLNRRDTAYDNHRKRLGIKPFKSNRYDEDGNIIKSRKRGGGGRPRPFDAWQQALERMWKAQESPIYMPAAILVLLEMVEADSVSDGVVKFKEFEQRFKSLLSSFLTDGKKPGNAWQPFFHLSRKSNIWALRNGQNPASFDDLPGREVRSRARLTERVDRAVLSSKLNSGLQQSAVRDDIRRAVLGRDGESVEYLLLRAAYGALPVDVTPATTIGRTRQAVVHQRVDQYRFRKLVLANFNGRCCLTGIAEPDLLIASHIVPWSEDETRRVDQANGLLLSWTYDRLFDKGYISFDDELRVLVTPQRGSMSDGVQQLLDAVDDQAANQPTSTPISHECLGYHRDNIWKR